jgi:hypothetical protein
MFSPNNNNGKKERAKERDSNYISYNLKIQTQFTQILAFRESLYYCSVPTHT